MIVIIIPLLLISLYGSVDADHKPPVLTVNLDAPPDIRWNNVMEHYKDKKDDVMKMFSAFVPKVFMPLVSYLGEVLVNFIPHYASEELRGIAKMSNFDLGHLTMMNLVYDFTAFDRIDGTKACTSIVAQSTDGKIYHGRNLDYSSAGILRNLTMIVNFQKNNLTLYTGITFAYYIGILTGQRPNSFSLSINERYAGPWYYNMLAALFSRVQHPLGLALRETLEHKTTYQAAVQYLSTVHLIAPCYIIIGGTKEDEGIVLTHDRFSVRNAWPLDYYNDRWYLLETNYDHWKAPSDERRKAGETAMNKTGSSSLNEDTLYKVLSVHPVLNRGTVYTTIMSAVEPSMMFDETFTRN